MCAENSKHGKLNYKHDFWRGKLVCGIDSRGLQLNL